jgi:hypothetical protein
MKAIYTSDNTAQIVERQGDIAEVTTGPGYRHHGETLCKVQNTGNGYIAHFPAPNCMTQDYYVCLDYAQARDLVLGLSMFKKELGFKDD